MFDREPDGDPHGECAAEIHALTKERDEARAERDRLRTERDRRESALRKIKSVHTAWYHGRTLTAEEAVREMEEIAVVVWMVEEPAALAPQAKGDA